MWQRPALLNALADAGWLIGLVLWGTAALWAAARSPWLPVREVRFMNMPASIDAVALATATTPAVRGNFMSVDLRRLRNALEAVPWVRRVDVQRKWPDRLEVTLEAQQPVARWQSSQEAAQGEWLVNRQGEVFAGRMDGPLPLWRGPKGESAAVLRQYAELSALLASLGRRISALELSSRLAWSMTLDDGMVVLLGREDARSPIADRVQRFTQSYPALQRVWKEMPQQVDLRYPNGLAVR